MMDYKDKDNNNRSFLTLAPNVRRGRGIRYKSIQMNCGATLLTSIFFSIFTRAAGSSEMRLKKFDVSVVFIANDVIVAMATSYRYDVTSVLYPDTIRIVS